MLTVKTITAAALIILSGSALADIRVIDTENGAWITVKDSAGNPESGATVRITNVPQERETYMTDENGRVYVPISLERSRSIKYEATTDDGKKQSRYAFHHTSND
ncbi:hypothetical protein [Thaumasiovibrio sp. DFM-14]|uniref:hypothetical protein n=1 Tax=Thaumasiovibrio sp. DFM-14 TaxID=3384792 RepID=UPI0039A29FB1